MANRKLSHPWNLRNPWLIFLRPMEFPSSPLGRKGDRDDATSLTAIVREVSSSINDCELSFHARQPIDVARAMRAAQGISGLSRRPGCSNRLTSRPNQNFRMPSSSRIRR